MLRSFVLPVLGLSLLLAACTAPDERAQEPESPAAVAEQLLDEERDDEERRALVEEHTAQAAAILRELVDDLQTDTEEEARRIPWIWRVTIEATGRGEAGQIRELIEVGLPEEGEPLLNWQGVVLGGGIVNGISRSGGWPRERIDDILEGHPGLEARWRQAVEQSYAMAADEEVPYPWRYDALRMIAMDEHDESIPELSAYLEPGLDDHLHMGAISGLSDVRAEVVPEVLIVGLPHFSERNRNLAFDALLRTERRARVLLDALAQDDVQAEELEEQHLEALLEHEDEVVRSRARELLAA